MGNLDQERDRAARHFAERWWVDAASGASEAL